jgi:hypothetical protein
MYKGSCLCGEVKYEILNEPKKVSHCHCTMCKKQHGAAFATYASLLKDDLVYTAGLSALVTYRSSGTIKRKFCGACGSSIEWGGSAEYPDWVSIAIATLDTPYKPEEIDDIFTDTKVCWLSGELN